MGTGGEIFHQALAFTYNDLTPNILKVRDREVCAYQSNGATADSLRSCHPLSGWMEKPAVQVVYLAWFYMVSLAGLYFVAGCIVVRMYLWLYDRLRGIYLLSMHKFREACNSSQNTSRRAFLRLSKWF